MAASRCALFIVGALGFTPSLAASSVTVQVSTGVAASTLAPGFAGLGWEMDGMLGMIGHLNDTRFVRAASGLSPAVVRVGGITGDWVRYVFTQGTARGGELAVPPPPHVGGYWPTSENNFTVGPGGDWETLTTFIASSGLSLMLTLNELHGRNCSTRKPGCPTCDPVWCVGPWDTSNVRALLQHIHDAGEFGRLVQWFELGNELISHQFPADTAADIVLLAGIIQEVWSDVPLAQRPLLFAPSTDACSDAGQMGIMTAITGVAGVGGFTYHGYPAQSGEGSDNLTSLLLNASWLRTRIMEGSAAVDCLAAWNAGPRAAGLAMWMTESSSSWSWQLPPPAQNSFLHGFFTVAELGQYATTGVGVVARWAMSEGSPFATIAYNSTRSDGGAWDAAADYFLLHAHKHVTGGAALHTTGGEASDALVYAACGKGKGSVVVSAVNPSLAPVTLDLRDVSGAALATAPRLEYVFTAPGDDLASFTPLLNGVGPPLRLLADGSAPDMPPRAVSGDGSPVVLPPRSQAFFVLTEAAAPAC